jgi:hypothetical protein
LGHELVLLDPRPREIQSLFNVILVVFLRFAEVDEQKISVDARGQLFCFDSYRGQVGCLTDSILFRFVPVVNGLTLLLLVQQLPNCTRLDPAEEFSLLLGDLLIGYFTIDVLMNSMSLTVVPVLPANFDSTWSYLLVLGILTSRTEGLPT